MTRSPLHRCHTRHRTYYCCQVSQAPPDHRLLRNLKQHPTGLQRARGPKAARAPLRRADDKHLALAPKPQAASNCRGSQVLNGCVSLCHTHICGLAVGSFKQDVVLVSTKRERRCVGRECHGRAASCPRNMTGGCSSLAAPMEEGTGGITGTQCGGGGRL